MVSKKTVTSLKHDLFSPFFLHFSFVLLNVSRWQQQRRNKQSVGFNTTDCTKDMKRGFYLKNCWVKICVERSILNQISPFFLQCHLVLQDENDWWQGQGGILSVGDGVIDRGVHQKCINLIEKIEHVVIGNSHHSLHYAWWNVQSAKCGNAVEGQTT